MKCPSKSGLNPTTKRNWTPPDQKINQGFYLDPGSTLPPRCSLSGVLPRLKPRGGFLNDSCYGSSISGVPVEKNKNATQGSWGFLFSALYRKYDFPQRNSGQSRNHRKPSFWELMKALSFYSSRVVYLRVGQPRPIRHTTELAHNSL